MSSGRSGHDRLDDESRRKLGDAGRVLFRWIKANPRMNGLVLSKDGRIDLHTSVNGLGGAEDDDKMSLWVVGRDATVMEAFVDAKKLASTPGLLAKRMGGEG